MIRNNPGLSSYFQGEYEHYGRYQWNIKYDKFGDSWEIEAALYWAFGSYLYSDGGHFEGLDEIVGRKVKASIQGRSGGWLVVHDELTDEELAKIDAHVAACMAGLPDFLKEEREFKESMTLAAEAADQLLKMKLEDSVELKAIKRNLENLGCENDCVLIIKGIRIL